jgi:hypothetical protein
LQILEVMNESINPMKIVAWWWWQGNEEEGRREGNPIQFGTEPNDSHPKNRKELWILMRGFAYWRRKKMKL